MTQQAISPQALENVMHEAAGRLLMCEPEKVAGWIVYLLECLDSNPWQGADFRETLRAVRAAINGRLEEGRW